MDQNLLNSLKRNSEILRGVINKVAEFRNSKSAENLPELPGELVPLSENLGKTSFTLVVSGEVNRGKSTFINAIIGKDILPTFDRETTSQVFKIKNSQNESYSVVLDDGTKIPINKNELQTYGTEVSSSEVNKKLGGKRILFIELCLPIANLPKNVTIVDTPGIGSTFKSHTEIAKGFIQEADAIIYICSSKHPIVKVDIDFIKDSILPIKTYPNMLFVMAKADLADSEDALNELVIRAENQLRENFDEYHNIGKKVIPVDSLSLQESNKSADREVAGALRDISNFDMVSEAVNRLIERQNFFWLVATFNCLARYYKKVNQFLENQLSDYDLNEAERKNRLASINERIKQFEADFGTSRQREVLENISNIISSFKADVKLEFASDKSSILKKYYEKIDNMPNNISSDELNEEAQVMSADIVNDATSVWEQLTEEAISEIQQTVSIYHKECEIVVDDEFRLGSNSTDDYSAGLNIKMSDRLQSIGRNFFAAKGVTLMGISSLAILSTFSSTAGTMLASLVAGPAGIIVAGGAIVYGIFYGNKKVKERAVANAKSDIKGHLKEILEEIYTKLAGVSLMNGKHESVIKSMEKAIRESTTDTLSDVYNRALGELNASKNELVISSDKQNRTRIVNQQSLFKAVAMELKKISPEIKDMSNAFEII